MTTRISKIARLPLAIRNELNARLQNGEIGRTLLPWLNSLPETKSVMADLFASKPITHQNLSEWRRAGYQDWLIQQQRLLWFQTLTEQESEFNRHDRSADTFEAMSNYYIFEMGQAINSLQNIKNSHERLDRLESLTREFTRLQNAFNWSRRVHLEWNKYNDTLPAPEPEPQPETQTSNLEPQTGEARIHASRSDCGIRTVDCTHDTSAPEQIATPEEKTIEIEPEIESSVQLETPNPKLETTTAPSPNLDLQSPTSDFQPVPTPAPTTPPINPHLVEDLNIIRKTRHLHLPMRGRRFVCVEG